MNGASPIALVSAVCNAGALGSLAATLLSPEAISKNVQQLRQQTTRPFNVNLFILDPPQSDALQIAHAQQLLAPFRQALGLPAVTDSASMPQKFCENFQDQLAVLRELAPPVVSFTFGILSKSAVQGLQRAGSLVIGTATTVAEAQAWEAAGADFVCAQGSEAGGHRGTFLGSIEQSCVGLMALLPQMQRAIKIPIIAAGGIMEGRGIAAALLLGAQAAQLGTAFLACPESGISASWRTQLQQARDDSTRLTRVFSGRSARGIVNHMMENLHAEENHLPPYPIQNLLTGEIRQAANQQARSEFMSLWAGQAASLVRPLPAAALIATLADELKACMS